MRKILYTIGLAIAVISCSYENDLPPQLEDLRLNHNKVELKVGESVYLYAVVKPSENAEYISYDYYDIESDNYNYYGYDILDAEWEYGYDECYNELRITALKPGEVWVRLSGYYQPGIVTNWDSGNGYNWNLSCKVIVSDSYEVKTNNITASTVLLQFNDNVKSDFNEIKVYRIDGSYEEFLTDMSSWYGYEDIMLTGLIPNTEYDLKVKIYNNNHDCFEKKVSFTTDELVDDIYVSLVEASSSYVAVDVYPEFKHEEDRSIASYIGCEISDSQGFFNILDDRSRYYDSYYDCYSFGFSYLPSASYFYCRPYVKDMHGNRHYIKRYMIDTDNQSIY